MLHLTIEKNQTICELQKQFNSIFPFLKMEFFTEPHFHGKLSAKNKQINPLSHITDIQNLPFNGTLEVKPAMTVNEFESCMEEYGLFPQVFRKSGSIWLETSATDHWSLEKQNEEGRSLKVHFIY